MKANNKTKAMRKIGSLEPANHQFTYSEILEITNNFERVIGKGGFGTVYHGYLNDTQVAVKMLSESSVQGYKEFQAEVHRFLRLHVALLLLCLNSVCHVVLTLNRLNF